MLTKTKPPVCSLAADTGDGGEARSLIHSTPIYASGKVIGHVRGDTFYKAVRGSVHFLRKPPAIALDSQSIADAARAGATWVEITDTESGKIYRARLDTIRKHGRVFNRGFGMQIYLCLHEWGKDSEAAQLSFAGVLA